MSSRGPIRHQAISVDRSTLAYVSLSFTYKTEEKSEDDLVLLALARVLSLTFLSSYRFIDKSFGFQRNRDLHHFYGEVVGWGQVEMLFYVDLTLSLNSLSRSRLLAKIEPVLNDSSIFQLLSAFLELPILDEDGRDWSALAGAGVPPAGLLSSVLLNFYLDEFDRAFSKRFPSLPYARYMHEVFVAPPRNNQENISLQQIENLVKEMELSAKLICIVRGGAPLPCYGGILSVGQDGFLKYFQKEA